MSKSASGTNGEKLIASNPKARSDYFIEEVNEAGIELTGTEVKSLRSQTPSLKDSYVDLKPNPNGRIEAYVYHLHIPPYTHGNIWNHEPLRKRRLLLHRNELDRLFGAVTQKGMTLIPLRLYFKKGRAKLELGLGKGKKKYDKREDLKARSAEREIDQARKRTQKY